MSHARAVPRALASFGVAATMAMAGPLTAQTPSTTTQQPQSALTEPISVSPGGAFVRSLIVPGWGHVAIGSYSRGGFYFALEAATAYAFLRTRHRLSEARDQASFREGYLRSGLAQQGVTAEDDIRTALDQDPILTSYRNLVTSRENQNEDLVAWGIFLLFLSGADAYVSAHLADFPEPIEVQMNPVASGRAEVSLRIPLPNP